MLQNFTLHSAPSKLLDNNSIWTTLCRKHVKQKRLLERVVRHMHPLCSCLREQRPLVLNSTWLEKILKMRHRHKNEHIIITQQQNMKSSLDRYSKGCGTWSYCYQEICAWINRCLSSESKQDLCMCIEICAQFVRQIKQHIHKKEKNLLNTRSK